MTFVSSWGWEEGSVKETQKCHAIDKVEKGGSCWNYVCVSGTQIL